MPDQNLKPGTRLWSTVSSAAIVVVRPPNREVTLTCGGAPLTDQEVSAGQDTGDQSGDRLLIGKRYVDEPTGLQVLCTRAGAGVLAVDGRPMTILASRPLPASD